MMIGARGTGTIPLIAAIRRHAKLCCIDLHVLQRNIQLTAENSLPGIVLTLIVRKPELKLFFFACVLLE